MIETKNFRQLVLDNHNSPILQGIQARYPLFWKYINHRFNQYEVKYFDVIFIEQLAGIVSEYSVELKNIELIATSDISFDSLGKKSRNTHTTNLNNRVENKNSYQGYNSDSDFNTTTTTNTNTGDNNSQSYSFSLENFIFKVNNSEFKKLWQQIINELCKLFVMYVF